MITVSTVTVMITEKWVKLMISVTTVLVNVLTVIVTMLKGRLVSVQTSQ